MKILYNPILLFFFLASHFSSNAQQQLQFNDYRENRELLNPAALFDGYNQYHNLYIGVAYREQGFGINNLPLKPRNLVAKGTWIGKAFNSSNFSPLIGANISSRIIGITQFNTFNLRIGAVNIANRSDNPNKNKSRFSAALNVSLNQFRLKASESQGLIVDDPLLQTNYTQSIPNVGMGVYYDSRVYGNKLSFYLGASIPQFFNLNLVENALLDRASSDIDPDPHLLIGLRLYNQSLTQNNRNNYLEITNWVFTNEYEELLYDTNFRYYLARYNLWLGSGYSSNQVVHSQIGFEIYKGWSKNNRSRYTLKQPILRVSIGYDFYIGSGQSPLQKAFEININRLIATR